MGTTTIEVKDDTHERLSDRKSRGDSFDDIVRELLDADEYHRNNGGRR